MNVLDHGKVILTLTLAPTTSPGTGHASSAATATLTQPPGGGGYSLGRHQLSAVFIPGGAFAKSTARGAFAVSPPAYTPLAGGVEIATVAPGSGPAIQPGQTANVLYTGYLAKGGKIFDDSVNGRRGAAGLHARRGASRPRLRRGTAGMQAGEMRVISIIPRRRGTAPGPTGPSRAIRP